MHKVKLYVNGEQRASRDGETFLTYSPSTGEIVAEIAKGTREDARLAVKAAVQGKEKLAKLSVWDRASLLRKIADRLEKNQEEVAHAIALEQGKLYHSEALGEVNRAVEGFGNASEHIKWLETSQLSVKDSTKRIFAIRQPKGVFGIITPWNFPVNIPVEYIAPALATGNAVVWLPAPTVSYCAWKLMESIIEADIPPGAVNFITGPGHEVGDEIVIHPEVNGIGFTGSTKTGNIISQRGHDKHLILELGGNGPTVILDDAGLNEENLRGIASSCFSNSGQLCTAAGRIVVHKSRESEVTSFLTRYAESIVVGESFDANATMGPLHNEDNCKKIDDHIADAVRRGGEVVVGGRRLENFKTRMYYEPTVIRNVHPDSLANCEETFGPVAPILTYTSDDELKKIVNMSRFGLSSAIFTSDMNKAFHLAESMNAGIVNINDRSNYWELHIPFGGVSGGESGRGRLGGMKILEEMTDLKTITLTIK